MDAIEKRIKSISEFFKDKHNLILIGIILLAFIIRLYYLIITKNQAFWWDESEYLSIAKHWVMGVPLDVNPQRTIMLPVLISFFYLIGFNEFWVKFFIILVPSVLIVLATYLLGKEMYNKKIGLLASFIMAIFWLLIFNTTRIHTDALAMMFTTFSIYYFWKYYEVHSNKRYLFLSALLLALAVITRPLAGIYVLIFGIYLIVVKKFNFIKDKNLWLTILIGLAGLAPLLIYDWINFGSPLAFISSYETGTNPSAAWAIFGYFKWFTEWLFFIIFLFGSALLLFNLIIGFDYVFKDKKTELKADFFNVIWILTYLIYFVFILRALTEDRWLMPLAVPIFFIISKGLSYIYLFIKKYNHHVAIVVITILLFYNGYLHIKHTDFITKAKISTYSQEPAAGIWLKQNTLPNDVLMSNNEQLPFTFYTERKVYGMSDTEEKIIESIKQVKPKYLILTGYYPSEQWTFQFPEKYKDHLVPVQAYTENDRPVIVIYQFKDYNF